MSRANWDEIRVRGVSIFGAGGFARDLARAFLASGVPVIGFVTSGPPATPTVDDLPVQALSEASPRDGWLAIGVFNREAHSDYGALQRLLSPRWPPERCLWPQALYGSLQQALGFRFWLHDLTGYAAAQPRIEAARALLDDDASREAFDAVLRYRSTAFAEPPVPHEDMQYLPRWLNDELDRQGRGALHLVDAGAYHGETLRELATRRTLAQAWTFEPDPANYARLVQTMRDWPSPLTHLPAAVGETCTTLSFSAGAGEASHLGAGPGASKLPVLAIDDALHDQPVDFVKLDVEGHELPALRGAECTLRRRRPTLAIAAYHRWDDLWTLPAYIDGLGLGYRLRLGLHGHNSFDTVLYAF